jgi:hypothetical protein
VRLVASLLAQPLRVILIETLSLSKLALRWEGYSLGMTYAVICIEISSVKVPDNSTIGSDETEELER